MTTSSPPADSPQLGLERRTQRLEAFRLQNAGVFYALIVIVASFAIATAATGRAPYLTAINTTNILDQAAPVAILAVFTTLVLISGNFDLSVSSNAALSAAVALAVINQASLVLGILGAIAVGMLVGLLNAVLVEVVGVNSFIVTLGTLTSLRGLLLVVTDGQSIQAENDDLSALVGGSWPIDARWLAVGCGAVLVVAGLYPGRRLFALPRPFLVVSGIGLALIGVLLLPTSWPLTKQAYLMFIIMAITWAALRFTVVGRRLYATGGNREAAQLSGISVRWYKMVPFVLTGFGAAVIGILYAGQFGSVSPTSLQGLELTALAAAILGGTSLFGGAGSVVNSVAGALLLIVLSNGFAVLNLGANYQLLIQGAVIIAAAAFFVIAERRGGRVRGQMSSISASATAAHSEPGPGERSGG